MAWSCGAIVIPTSCHSVMSCVAPGWRFNISNHPRLGGVKRGKWLEQMVLEAVSVVVVVGVVFDAFLVANC